MNAKRGPSCSQEVGDHVAVVDDASSFSHSVEDFEVVFHLFVHRHNRSNITTSVAVVGSGPYCNEVRVLEPELETIHDKLMGSSNQI